jgi:flagellar protein FliJ
MKSREALIRAATFDLAEKRRKLSDIDAMIAEFRRMSQDLEQQIEAEHVRTGVRDANHFAYSSFAKAARKRCDNLQVTIADLQTKREPADRDLAQAEDELKRVQMASDRANEERPSSGRRAARHRMMSAGGPPRSA